jgi:hypothetical protein
MCFHTWLPYFSIFIASLNIMCNRYFKGYIKENIAVFEILGFRGREFEEYSSQR